MNEKEKTKLKIDKSIRNSKNIDDRSVNFGKIDKIDNFHQGDIILSLNDSQIKKKSDDKLKASERSMNNVTEEGLKVASELSEEETKILRKIVEKLREETKKEEKNKQSSNH